MVFKSLSQDPSATRAFGCAGSLDGGRNDPSKSSRPPDGLQPPPNTAPRQVPTLPGLLHLSRDCPAASPQLRLTFHNAHSALVQCSMARSILNRDNLAFSAYSIDTLQCDILLHVNILGYRRMSNPNNDCFRTRYAVILLGFICLSQVGAEIADANKLLFPVFLIFLTFLAMFIYIISAFLYNLVKLRWKHLLSILAAVLAALSLISLQDCTGLDPEYLRFVLLRPYYTTQVNEMPPAPIRFKAWFWNESGGGIAGNHEFDALIYDETEQLLLPPELRTDEWISAVEACSNYTELDLSAIASSGPTRNNSRKIRIKVLGRHFFMVSH